MAYLAIIALLFILSSILTFLHVSKIQQTPYMDEVFHVPQVQQYCNANFSHWDPMITTLPGLYLVSVGLLKPVIYMFNLPIMEACSTFWLRGTNLMFAVGNFYLIYAILKKLHNPLTDSDGMKLCMTTLALAMFPVLYFFTFLYYTDPGAIFFVLLMYLFCIHGNHVMAASIGVIAILFRQTNIIWVVYAAGLAVRKEIMQWMQAMYEKKDVKLDNLSDWEMLKLTCNTVLDLGLKRKKLFTDLVKKICRQVVGYIIVGIGFGVFIFLNKGIVVGDRTQHEACLHLPQLFYFFLMVNCFAVFQLSSPYKIKDFIKFCWKHPVYVVLFFAAAYFMIHYYTYEHMYLLGDNRHYTFYIWRKIYRRYDNVKYAFIPVYLYCIWAFLVELQHRDIFWKIVYFICVFAATVPQKLLEYRYFILPYLIYRINMRYSSRMGVLHEILLYLVLNIGTVYLFTQKSFKWPHEDGVQRFMW